jgi:hypothetical protein
VFFQWRMQKMTASLSKDHFLKTVIYIRLAWIVQMIPLVFHQSNC